MGFQLISGLSFTFIIRGSRVSHNELGWILLHYPFLSIFAVVFLLPSVGTFQSFVNLVCIIVHEVFLGVYFRFVFHMLCISVLVLHIKLPFVHFTLFSLLNVKVLIIKGENVSMLGFNFSLFLLHCTITLGGSPLT